MSGRSPFYVLSSTCQSARRIRPRQAFATNPPLSYRPSYLSAHTRATSSQSNSKSPNNASRPLEQIPLTSKQEEYLHNALRVNHVGELAAVRIYTSQYQPVVRQHPTLSPLMRHMHDQELYHFNSFNRILPHFKVRPSVLYPAWETAASTLGWATGVLGKEAAMACTEAVETVIGRHYNDQIVEIAKWETDANGRGQTLGPDMLELLATLRQFRDEELEHLDHAVEHDSQSARPYEFLTEFIKSGCRAAIWVAKRA